MNEDLKMQEKGHLGDMNSEFKISRGTYHFTPLGSECSLT